MNDQAPVVKGGLRNVLIGGTIGLFAVIIFGLLWLFFLAPAQQSGLGWFLFSFAAGLSMIVLPCTLPLAFVIVPLSMGKGLIKGLGIALSFGAGVALMLSVYGVLAAAIGGVAIDTLGAPLEVVKNWVYFIAGIFALLFALGEIGLIKVRMPSYTGSAPAFIQKKQDYLKAFLLGMFLGNIGVGCPHPATPLIFVEIASSGDVMYGWLLFLTHAIGRILPLLLLAFLGILGVNGLAWLVARKEKVERATGWAMVFVAGFILTLGLFTHDWWVNSGIHTMFEKITFEHQLLGIVKDNLNSTVVHSHGIATGTGLFGLPLWLGNWVLVGLWILPLWWWYKKEKKRVSMIPELNVVSEKAEEMKVIHSQKKFYIALTLLLGLTFIYLLPNNFLKQQMLNTDHAHTPNTPAVHDHAPADAETSTHDHGTVMTVGMPAKSMDSGHGSQFHEEKNVLSGFSLNLINPTSVEKAGISTSLVFFSNIQPSADPVDDLEIEHEAYIHTIGVKEDLSEFFHIHPQKIATGTWAVSHVFPTSGNYKMWSDTKRGGTIHTFGHPIVSIASNDGTVATSSPGKIYFMKNVIVEDQYQVSLQYPEPIVKGRATPLHFLLSSVFANGLEIEPYLGAQMHLAVIKDDLTEYIHTHPSKGTGGTNNDMDSESDGHNHDHGFNIIPRALAHGDVAGPHIDPTDIDFEVVFPSAGVYKLFAQFRPKGSTLPPDQSVVAEFYVKVAEDGPAYTLIHETVTTKTNSGTNAPLGRGPLTFISLVLMVALGFGVRKFIQVK
jgi:cytochrome c-type biogenesis protein